MVNYACAFSQSESGKIWMNNNNNNTTNNNHYYYNYYNIIVTLIFITIVIMMWSIWDNSFLNCGCRWKWRMIIAINFQFKQLERRSLKKKTGFEPVTSALRVFWSTNWAMKPHIGSEVNLLSTYLPWGVKWCEAYEIIHFWSEVVDESEEWSS